MADLPPPVVIKVGGSLLDWPILPLRLGAYLASRKGDRLVVIVGGSAAADWVRDLDRIHEFDEEKAHTLALRALDLSAYVLSALISFLEVVEAIESIPGCWGRGRIPILAPRSFLERDDGQSPDPLPHSWDVTTDSIAARLAERLAASELVLLKSVSLPGGADRDDAARLGLVDRAFPLASKHLKTLTYVNLRLEVPGVTPGFLPGCPLENR